MKLIYGDSAARLVSERIAAVVATMAALITTPTKRCVDGMICHVLADDTMWQYDAASVLTHDGILVAVNSDAAGVGAWLRMPGACKLVLPFTFATADATALLTFQAGQEFHLQELYWDASVDFGGGASSTIGVSSNKTGFSTKGDLLGGAAGSLAAALTAAATPNFGTIGAGFDTLAKRRVALFKSADTIRHDRITSAFTSGAASVVLLGNLAKNLGA